MKTAHFIPAQIWTIAQAHAGNAVFIRPEGSNLALPVYVTESDIQVILVELTHILAPRPMVHELLLSAVEALHGSLERVEIYGIRCGSYLCRVILLQDGREIALESKPSDILCLAARVACPVHVEDGVLAKNGVPADKVVVDDSSVSVPAAPSIADFLGKELRVAVEKEDYERAAILRDQIGELTRQ